MDEKLTQEIKAMVDSFFSEKEEAEVRRKTEEALQKSADTISELTAALEDKSSESEELAAKVAELETQIAELQTGLEAAGRSGKHNRGNEKGQSC
jgi:predicted transcriptional regulator